MDAIISKPRVWPIWKELRHFSVSVACEDPASSIRTDEFFRGLTRELSGKCRLARETWLFNQLCVPELRTIAASEAALAQLVIISVHHFEALPEGVKDWIDLWLGMRNNHSSVLSALLDPVYRGFSGPVEGYLRQVAKRGGMEFLVTSDDTRDWR